MQLDVLAHAFLAQEDLPKAMAVPDWNPKIANDKKKKKMCKIDWKLLNYVFCTFVFFAVSMTLLCYTYAMHRLYYTYAMHRLVCVCQKCLGSI